MSRFKQNISNVTNLNISDICMTSSFGSKRNSKNGEKVGYFGKIIFWQILQKCDKKYHFKANNAKFVHRMFRICQKVILIWYKNENLCINRKISSSYYKICGFTLDLFWGEWHDHISDIWKWIYFLTHSTHYVQV